jgi:hypothetical protein
MESTQNKPKKVSLQELTGTFQFMWKELRRDPQAFRILIACTLGMVTAGLEPAFLTLSTPEIQTQL